MTEAEKSKKEREELTRDLKSATLVGIAIISLIGMCAGLTSAVYSSRSADRSGVSNETAQQVQRSITIALQSAEDAGCIREYGAKVTDARTIREDAQSDLLLVLARQASAVLGGNEASDSEFDQAQSALVATKSLVDGANGEYQRVVAAERGDPEAFTLACKDGPTP